MLSVVELKQLRLTVQFVAMWTTFRFTAYTFGLRIWVPGGSVCSNPTSAERTVQVELVPLVAESPPTGFKEPIHLPRLEYSAPSPFPNSLNLASA
jgi:hypothetical protein